MNVNILRILSYDVVENPGFSSAKMYFPKNVKRKNKIKKIFKLS